MRYRFIGIGGVSMSGLALCLAERGNVVTGSDAVSGEYTQMLIEKGIPVDIGSRPEKAAEWDRVVYTSAIRSDDPELTAAAERGVPAVERGVLLGEVFNERPHGIAVSGMHGKSTVTALVAHIFEKAEMDPLCFFGAKDGSGRNYISGDGSVAIAEACEYRRNFLALKPYIAVVLNMELEHTDYYGRREDVYAAFEEFISGVKEGGAVVAHESAAGVLHRRCISYGEGERCVFRAVNMRSDKGRYIFDVLYRGRFVARLRPSLYGRFNAVNALCAFAVAFISGIGARRIADSIADFKGIERRFEAVTGCGGKTVIFDYAHHPSEIRATLAAVTECFGHAPAVVFQPHTYSRTKSFLSDFAETLACAEEVILLPVFAAREAVIPGGETSDLLQALKEREVKSMSVRNLYQAAEAMRGVKNDIIAVLGAGDVYNLKKYI